MNGSRVSIMGGRIFNDSDREFRGFRIPVEFFKTVLYERNGKLGTRSFVLTQDLGGLEFLDLERFKTYEVAPEEIEARCSFKFDPVVLESSEFDFRNLWTEERRPIWSTGEIHW